MFLEMCIIGPLAAMFGREFQQYLLVNKGTNKIPVEEFDYSVNSGRTSLSEKRISAVHNEPVEEDREDDRDDRASQVSKRTRSPRKAAPLRGAPWKQSPTNRRDVDIRDHHDDRRPRDIRNLPDYDRLREQHRAARGGDVRDQGNYPREGDPRGTMGDRRSYTHSEPREPRPYDNPKDRSRRRY